ncbi:MAG: putative Ig domain-containing protein, partial [Verrucomicrobiota bacterium]
SGPTGLGVSPAGLVNWTPTEAQGPGTYSVTVQVTDNGTPGLSATQSFQIVVNEVNVAPVLVDPPDTNINEGVAWTYQLSASDADQPANTLTFALVSGPTGLGVSPAGLVNWTPSEAQGPGTYSVTVQVTDNGTPGLSATQSFQIVVNEVNVAPQFSAIPTQFAHAGGKLVLTATATDSDSPANALSYSLVAGPAGASIASATGVFTWSTTEADLGSTNAVTLRVSDDGVPSRSDTNTFSIVVVSQPVIQQVSASAGTVTLTWSSLAGQSYRVQHKSDLLQGNWTDLNIGAAGIIVANGPTASASDNTVGAALRRFYRVSLVTVP